MNDPDDIACWQRISPVLTSSGRLNPDDPERLARLGVATVINLALLDSPGALPDERERMAACGIAYVHIPVPFGAPDDAHFETFAGAMEAAGDAPTHVHCIMNWRVSAFLYRWHRSHGMPEAQARELLRRQWEPESSDHPDAGAWARFIAAGAPH